MASRRSMSEVFELGFCLLELWRRASCLSPELTAARGGFTLGVTADNCQSRWDEYVEESRLKKYTEENVAVMMGMRAKAEEESM